MIFYGQCCQDSIRRTPVAALPCHTTFCYGATTFLGIKSFEEKPFHLLTMCFV